MTLPSVMSRAYQSLMSVALHSNEISEKKKKHQLGAESALTQPKDHEIKV